MLVLYRYQSDGRTDNFRLARENEAARRRTLRVIQAQSGEAAADQLRRSSLLRVAHIARDGRITRQSSIFECLPAVAEGAWTKCRRPRMNMAYLNARLEAMGTPLALFTA
jgi:hypothetical protein